MASRWADTANDIKADLQRQRDREVKKAAKAEKQRLLQERVAAAQPVRSSAARDDEESSVKRRRIDPEGSHHAPRLRLPASGWGPARTIEHYERLNDIDQGTYGLVTRARELFTNEIVAIKEIKLVDVALREIQILQAARHRHVVHLREVINGPKGNTDQVFLVMEFVQHDLKTLMDNMQDHECWTPSEVKTLILQMAGALEYLHDSLWIIHRDLKTSNILMNNRGEIKIADFGMARYTSDPPPTNLTSLVVTLWYRSPELLLGTTTYDTSVDMWSLGCIFGELLTKTPILPGRNEVDQLDKIFEFCGLPTDESWPGYRRLPNASTLRLPRDDSLDTSQPGLERQFPYLTKHANDLFSSLLSLDSARRPSAGQVLSHAYFTEEPRPKRTAMFPSFPSKAGQERRRKNTPDAPVRTAADAKVDFSTMFTGTTRS